MKIGVAGGGAFGTALAISLAMDDKDTLLWARNPDAADVMDRDRVNPKVAGAKLPAALIVTSDIAQLLNCDTILLAMPAQRLRGFLGEHKAALTGKYLVACCKGIDLDTLTGPVASINDVVPDAVGAILTGPSFAADIAHGLPTALTLATANDAVGAVLQNALSTQNLRLYRTTDVVGAELGGALKNVIAIACGAAIGAGFGDSARAAVMTRGFAETQRLAAHLGANPQTMTGLSGFGDLALTCNSMLSRNYRYGVAIGEGAAFDASTTVEGAATAVAVTQLAQKLDMDLPICRIVAALTQDKIDVKTALQTLLSRPLKEE